MGTPGRTPKKKNFNKISCNNCFNLKFQRGMNTMAIRECFNRIRLPFMYSLIKLVEKKCKICVTNFHSPLCFFKLSFSDNRNKTMCKVSSSRAGLPTQGSIRESAFS